MSGSNDTVNAMSGDVIALHRGSDDTIDGVGMTVDANWARSLVLAGGDPGAVDLDGYGNGVTIADAVDVNLQGSCNVVAATADDVITLGAGHRNLFTGGEFSIDAASGDSFSVRSVLQTSAADSGLITVAGSGFSLAIAGASNVTLSGSDDAVAVGTGSVVDLTGGAGDTFLGAGFTLDAATGTSLSVGGAGEHWRHGHGGPTPDIVDGSSITLAVLGKSSVDLNGSDDTVALANGSSLTIMGANDAVSLSKGDTVVAGLDDQIDDLGSSNFIEVDGAVGALKIAGFGSDAMGVVSLGAGVGGFANVSAIVAALTSDGNGGTLLSLGADGSIDFAGVALSALGASHFAIA